MNTTLRGMLLGALLYHAVRMVLDHSRTTAQAITAISRITADAMKELAGEPVMRLTYGEWLAVTDRERTP